MPKVYVQCKFRPNDGRTYTYSWEGEPLNKGDIVRVPDKLGTGWQRVTVDSVGHEAPAYKCKAILGLYNPDVEPDKPAREPVPEITEDFLDLGDDADLDRDFGAR